MTAICILSWKAHKTLTKTLDSYTKHNLWQYFNEKIIFFQEISQQDIEIAGRYGLKYMGTKENIGIAGAWKEILRSVNSDKVLFLESDCLLIEPQIQDQLFLANKMLDSGEIDIFRLRHRFQVGQNFDILDKYKAFFGPGLLKSLWRKLRPIKAQRLVGAAIYAHDHPHIVHPHYIQKHSNIYITSSR